MAAAFPWSRFTGFDFSAAGIATARPEANRSGRVTARFEEREAAHLGETARFDFITTFDVVHDQARRDLMLAGIARALRPVGSTSAPTPPPPASSRRTWTTRSTRPVPASSPARASGGRIARRWSVAEPRSSRQAT
jgi:2-polyprenyl-3-methyl-5-hydroxy-6-metoxy-1,4-benzoquinol methylase